LKAAFGIEVALRKKETILAIEITPGPRWLSHDMKIWRHICGTAFRGIQHNHIMSLPLIGQSISGNIQNNVAGIMC